MKQVMAFLKSLEQHNTREWFNEHKATFQEAEKEFKGLVHHVQEGLSTIDEIRSEATKIFRIYRDVRFSADKTPYHRHRSASFKRATAERRGGYYLRIQRGASVIVGGFFGPNSADMLHIRKQIQQDPDPLRELLKSTDVVDYFGGLQGDQVKSAPRGFAKDDPAIDLLKYKQLILRRPFTDKEVMAPGFAQKAVEGFAKMRPFFDYMSDILTTDLNGEPIGSSDS